MDLPDDGNQGSERFPLPVQPEVAPLETSIFGAIDGFQLPAYVSGWAIQRQDEQYIPGLRIEICRNDIIIGQTLQTGARVDVTQDEAVAAAFALDCQAFTSARELLDGSCQVFAVDSVGQRQLLEIFAPVRQRIEQELVLEAEQAEAYAEQQRQAAQMASIAKHDQPLATGTHLHHGSSAIRHRTTGPRITFIGAGSTVFAKNLLGDILSDPTLADSRICLYDIDPERLRVSEVVAGRIVQTLASRARIETTMDLGQALDGADYAINMIQVGGYRPCTVTDFELPNRFGLRQTIGDTLGIGGIMRALRTIPVLTGMAAEMEARCPQVLHLNYVNPMAMNCWALARSSRIQTVGLCHSVQGTAAELAHDIDVPLSSIRYMAAGINHMSFYLSFTSNGEDLYPRIRQVAAEGRIPQHNRVRYDMLARLGYFVTESSEHFAEYVPWYIKQGRRELIERFNIPLDEYPRRCELQIADWKNQARELQDPGQSFSVVPSNEYGARIIRAIETGEPVVINGNVPNTGLIDNLPEGCCVEVPCLVDGNGLKPVRVGPLPLQLSALMQTNINVQALTVEAALTGRRDHIYHAAMLDPHTAAELDLDQISSLVDALLEAHRPWLPEAFYG